MNRHPHLVRCALIGPLLALLGVACEPEAANVLSGAADSDGGLDATAADSDGGLDAASGTNAGGTDAGPASDPDHAGCTSFDDGGLPTLCPVDLAVPEVPTIITRSLDEPIVAGGLYQVSIAALFPVDIGQSPTLQVFGAKQPCQTARSFGTFVLNGENQSFCFTSDADYPNVVFRLDITGTLFNLGFGPISVCGGCSL